MSRRVSRLAIVLFILLLGIFALTRRDFSRSNPRIFTEMSRSPAYGPQSANTLFHDGRTLRQPVPGTIPRGHAPYRYANTPADRERAGKEVANPVAPSITALNRGCQVYQRFCSICHGRSGQGDGTVASRVSAFSMNIVGKATADLPDGTLFHIITHGQNNMPAHTSQIAQDDRWKLVYYLRDLQRAETERLRRHGIESYEDPRKDNLVSADYGRELYGGNCGSCHGPDGRNPLPGTPTLNSPKALAITDEDFYLEMITHGRRGTDMSAWGKVLTATQIRSLGVYIRSWSQVDRDRSMIAAASGNVAYGRALFRGNCAPCHGQNGEGGIGISLASPSFQGLASDSFLRDTIALGRGHTAMPAGYDFSSEEVSDILAYIRTWSQPRSTYQEVEALMPEASSLIGEQFYQGRCAACHGRDGEGGIGSRLNSDNFLSIADDRFLYTSIALGRPGTAMPSWHHIESEEIAHLISFLRTWQKSEPRKLAPSRRAGRAEFGELLYRQSCAACHGPNGGGGTGSQIANPVFLASASDEFLWQLLAYGKDLTVCRPFLKGAPGGALMAMSSSDIDHIIAFLRQLGLRPDVDRPEKTYPETMVDFGRTVFQRTNGCAKCHGNEGEGANGPVLGNPDFLKVASDGYLTGTIILGREHSLMSPHRPAGNDEQSEHEELSQEEVEAVVAYIRSLEDRDVKLRRRLKSSEMAVAQGEKLYRTYCSSCHGSEGRGPRNNAIDGYAPSLNNPEFLRVADDGFLLATIAMGSPRCGPFAKGAGGFADLYSDEIRQLVTFIRSWEDQYDPTEEAEVPR